MTNDEYISNWLKSSKYEGFLGHTHVVHARPPAGFSSACVVGLRAAQRAAKEALAKGSPLVAIFTTGEKAKLVKKFEATP